MERRLRALHHETRLNKMEDRMKFDFISRLKIAFSRLALHRAGEPSAPSTPIEETIASDDGRERSARDYEFYYWCSTPAPWY